MKEAKWHLQKTSVEFSFFGMLVETEDSCSQPGKSVSTPQEFLRKAKAEKIN